MDIAGPVAQAVIVDGTVAFIVDSAVIVSHRELVDDLKAIFFLGFRGAVVGRGVTDSVVRGNFLWSDGIRSIGLQSMRNYLGLVCGLGVNLVNPAGEPFASVGSKRIDNVVIRSYDNLARFFHKQRASLFRICLPLIVFGVLRDNIF